MSKELAKAVRDLLDTLWDEAEGSHAEGTQRIFNNAIWKKYDPILYGHYNKISKLLKANGL